MLLTESFHFEMIRRSAPVHKPPAPVNAHDDIGDCEHVPFLYLEIVPCFFMACSVYFFYRYFVKRFSSFAVRLLPVKLYRPVGAVPGVVDPAVLDAGHVVGRREEIGSSGLGVLFQELLHGTLSGDLLRRKPLAGEVGAVAALVVRHKAVLDAIGHEVFHHVRPSPLKEEGHGADDAVGRVAACGIDVDAVEMRFLAAVVTVGLGFHGSAHLISLNNGLCILGS